MKLVDEHHNEPYNDIDDIDFYRKKNKRQREIYPSEIIDKGKLDFDFVAWFNK